LNRISVVIITRDEENNLPRSLKSVAWAGDIVLVDSGSTDRTIAIAEAAGARVLRTEWRGFGHSKQIGVNAASGEWILSVDADEEVSPMLAAQIQKAVNSDDGTVGYYVPRLTRFLGRWMRHGGWYPDYVLRLFRKDAGRFSDNIVHESVLVDGSTRRLSEDLLHYCYPTMDNYISKMNRYTSLAALELHRSGQRAGLVRLLVNPLAKFVKQYFLRAGFLDGAEGLTLALLSAGYVFTKYAKLRDLYRQPRKDTLRP
jgi:glycosyltransferase involved in cell wall biosynthesis